MATPQERLAEALEALHKLQGHGAIRSRDLSRTHRERLVASGFLKEVIKGWYIPSRPDEAPGDSTSWYASFWEFCGSYLTERFGEEWSLSRLVGYLDGGGRWRYWSVRRDHRPAFGE